MFFAFTNSFTTVYLYYKHMICETQGYVVDCFDESRVSLTSLLQRCAVDSHAGSKNSTHYSLNGGKYMISMENGDNEKFLQHYSSALFLKEPTYLIERRTPTFKWHVDLDITEEKGVQPTDIYNQYLPCIQQLLRDFYKDAPETTFTCLLLSSPFKKVDVVHEKTRESVSCTKSGFHLHWPNLVVNAQTALMLRDNIVARLQKEKCHRDRAWPKNPLDDVVDKQIYLSNGLRMVGSDKRKVCPNLQKKVRKTCDKTCSICGGAGRVDEKRPYTVSAVVNLDLSFDAVLSAQISGGHIDNIEKTVQLCSTRTLKPVTPGFFAPDNAVILNERQRKQIQAAAKAETGDGTVELDVNVLDPKSPLFRCIEKLIQTGVHTTYSDLKLSKVSFRRGGSERYYICNVKSFSPGSSFCQNVARSHSSSKVYFSISELTGLGQRCYSSKKCKGYCSDKVCVPFSLQKALFPTYSMVQQTTADPPSTVELCDANKTIECAINEPVLTFSPPNFLETDPSTASRKRKWEEPNLKLRSAVLKKAKGKVVEKKTNCQYTWDQLDTLSTVQLYELDKKRAKNSAVAYKSLNNDAAGAKAAIEELWRQPTVTPTGKVINSKIRNRWS